MNAQVDIHAHRIPLPAPKEINLVLKNCHYCFGMHIAKGHIPCTAHLTTFTAQTSSESRSRRPQLGLNYRSHLCTQNLKNMQHLQASRTILTSFTNNLKSASNATSHFALKFCVVNATHWSRNSNTI